MKEYDVVVIGSGPAGHYAAIQAAKLGKKVAIAEKRQVLGGVCLNTGTIPSKTLREAVIYLTGLRQKAVYGMSYAVKRDITMGDLRLRTSHVIKTETEVFRAQLQRNHVDLLVGTASFQDAHRLVVENGTEKEECSAAVVVIATGASPAHSDRIPLDGSTIVDSDMFLDIASLPRSLTIVGAGVIGVEYACMTAALGINTTLVEARDTMLEFLDAEIVEALRYHMRDMGITLRLREEVVSVRKTAEGTVVADLKSRKEIHSQALLYTVGRQGNTRGLNLSAASLEADDRGRIKVNERYQTSVPHIYAVGDVIGFPSLASVSMMQGRLAVCHAFGVPFTSVTNLFPYGIYTIPEISYVGQNEDQLTEQGIPYEVGIARYREIARGNIIGDQDGLLKLLFHRQTRELMGVHIIGEGAAELIHIGQAVLTFGGGLDYFLNSVFNYPTLAECYKVAAHAGANKISQAAP
ncbi:MAG: Si-specific NAD(P)(+) transhydrogenase [Acidimicrobiia bacterium]|nr:Si-specific NAD(P)(+) transhydrogenase [Acidimicrobiia bacterium]